MRILKAVAINTWDAGGASGAFAQEGRMPSREPSFDTKNSLARACGEKPRVVRILLHNPLFHYSERTLLVMGTRQAEAALDKVGFFLTSNTGLGDMERHDACPMAANSCFIPRTILYNTLFEIIGLLSPFCAALVSRPRWNPRAAAISPALIHNCNTYDIPTRYTVLVTPGSSGPSHHWSPTVGFLANSLQPRFWFGSQTPYPVRSQRLWPRIPVPISRQAELRTGAPICPHSGWERQGSRPWSSTRDPETEALSCLERRG